MGLVDRINDAVLRRLGRAGSTGDPSIALADRIDDIDELVAVRTDGFVGDGLKLLALFKDGQVVEASEGDAGWPVLLRQLDASGRTTLSSTMWTLELVGGATSLTLIDKGQPK